MTIYDEGREQKQRRVAYIARLQGPIPVDWQCERHLAGKKAFFKKYDKLHCENKPQWLWLRSSSNLYLCGECLPRGAQEVEENPPNLHGVVHKWPEPDPED